MTAKIDTAKLRRLAENTTPGPWHCRNKVGVVYGPDCIVARCGDFAAKELVEFNGDRWKADAAHIAAANPAVILALLDELDAARKAEAAAYERAAEWCRQEAYRLGAVDGYSYASGQEYAFSRAAAAIRAFGEEGA